MKKILLILIWILNRHAFLSFGVFGKCQREQQL